MKAVAVLVCILLVITSSAASAAPARKLAGDDGQQTGETQAMAVVVVDGKRSDGGHGDHDCKISKFPCLQGLEMENP
ncbi:hypothetical protein BRADI_5g02831v3 [Brachypodium distachyon]|uniref:Uncharacterized protein n=1 Tax=Brachypodium distachyon TaxID=15368 RepID=A0A2K2CF41_BRADI|nr:hypothetical protein BRADI_5g02831v3 [Brachypodium distachyon]